MKKRPLSWYIRSIRYRINNLIYGKALDEVDLLFNFLIDKRGNSGILVDVGAHHGSAALPFAKKGWKVYCFEPDAKNRKVLVENIEANGVDIEVIPKAVGKEEGYLTFYTSPVSTGISSLLSFHDSHREAGQIEVVSLSHFLKLAKVKGLDFLKIDTEGYDFFVLQGTDFEKYPVKVVVCEYEDKKTEKLNYSYIDVVKYLEDQGFVCLISEWEPIIEYGKRHKWKRLTTDFSSINKDTSWGNIIAVTPDWADSLFKYLETATKKY